MTAVDLLVDGLCAYRLTRLATRDTITEPVRDWIEARSVEVSSGRCGATDRSLGRSAPPCTRMSGHIGRHVATDEGHLTIADWSGPSSEPTLGSLVDVQPYAFARDALDCGWCTGVWAGLVTVLLPRPVRRALAIAAVAGFLSER